MEQTLSCCDPFDNLEIEKTQEELAQDLIDRWIDTQEEFYRKIIRSYNVIELIEIKTGLKVKSLNIEYQNN
jgi:hypothetical protein